LFRIFIFSFIVTFLTEDFVEFIAEKIIDLLPIFEDEAKYVICQKYNIDENEKIIEKVIKNYRKSETVTIDKENLKEIYLENYNLVRDNKMLSIKNKVYLITMASIIVYTIFRQ
jgi:hypothetical protein